MCEQLKFELDDERDGSCYDGLDARRLDPEQNNPYEIALHDAWVEENAAYDRDDLLEKLFPEETITYRDKKIAATVIQWLGTNCGRGYLDRARSKMKNIRGKIETAKFNAYFLENI